MDRRSFLRRSAIVATGLIAADQLEILERLTYKRTMFPGHRFEGGRIYIDVGGDTWIYEGKNDLFSDAKLIELGADPVALAEGKIRPDPLTADSSMWEVDFSDIDNFYWRERGPQRS